MNARALIAVLLLTMIPGVSAWASPPANANYVDPKAPCYRWPAVDMDRDGVFDRVDNCVNTPEGCVVDDFGCHSDSDGDGVCDGVDQCPDTPSGSEVDEAGCADSQRARAMEPPREIEKPRPAPAPVTETERQLRETGRIRLENVYFESGSAKMLPESEDALNELGAALEKYPKLRVEVQGHTDTRGSARYNMSLSQLRAEAVREYLVNHFRVSGDNVVAKGYGETRPETEERNQEELLRNRRVEIHVLNPDALPRGVEVERHE